MRLANGTFHGMEFGAQCERTVVVFILFDAFLRGHPALLDGVRLVFHERSSKCINRAGRRVNDLFLERITTSMTISARRTNAVWV